MPKGNTATQLRLLPEPGNTPTRLRYVLTLLRAYAQPAPFRLTAIRPLSIFPRIHHYSPSKRPIAGAYKDLAVIGASINQAQNLTLIRFERAIANEKHTRARDASIRAIQFPIAGAPRHTISTPTGAIGRRVYKDLALIGFAIYQPQNLSLIRIDHATPNEKHTRARDESIRAIKSPIAGAPRHPTSTPTGAIGRRVYKDRAIIGFSIHQPKPAPKLAPYPKRARHSERESHTRPRRIHPSNKIPHRGRSALSDIDADWRHRTTRI